MFVLANSIDPPADEIPHYEAFDLSLHCLPKYAFRSQNDIVLSHIYVYVYWILMISSKHIRAV